MFRLIGLEIRKNNYVKYFAGVLFVTVLLLGLTYLFAFIPHLKGSSTLEISIMEAITPVFSSYSNIRSLICVLSMVCFSIYSALIFSEFVLNDYTGKKFYLLLAYPIRKGTLYFAKIVASILVVLLSTILCNAVVFTIFYLMELTFPMVTGDIMTKAVIYDTIKLVLVFSVLSLAIGLISLRIGFIKKSTHFALITSFIISLLISNFLGMSLLSGVNSANNVFVVLALTALVIAIILSFSYTGTVNEMEGE